MTYNSSWLGSQIDDAVSNVRNSKYEFLNNEFSEIHTIDETYTIVLEQSIKDGSKTNVTLTNTSDSSELNKDYLVISQNTIAFTTEAINNSHVNIGEEYEVNYISEDLQSEHLVLRNSEGKIQTNDPSEAYDAVNISYMENWVFNLPISTWGGKSAATKDVLDESGTILEIHNVGSIAFKGENEYASNDLSNISSPGVARTNLGIYSTTESEGSFLQITNNLDDVEDAELSRNNLDVFSTNETSQEAFLYTLVFGGSGLSDSQFLNVSDNLEDLEEVSTARTNLDVYSTTEVDSNFLQVANNLNDLDNATTARTNLDVYSTTEVDSNFLQASNNLNDLDNATTARTNLDVYSTTETYSTTESDSNFLQVANNLNDLDNATTARTNLDVYSTTESDSNFLQVANNLSDLDNATTARTNLDVYSTTETYSTTEVDNKFIEAPTSEYDCGSVSTTLEIDRDNGMYQKVELTGDTTLSFINIIVGEMKIKFIQDSTGGHILTFPTAKWLGGTAGSLTATASAEDILSVYWDGSNYYMKIDNDWITV